MGGANVVHTLFEWAGNMDCIIAVYCFRFFQFPDLFNSEMTKDEPGRGFLGYLCCCCVGTPQALVTVKTISAVDLEKQDMTGAGTNIG